MIGVLLLNLAEASRKVGEMVPYRTLSSLTVGGEVGLGTLAGFSLSSILSSHAQDPSVIETVTSNTRKFQAYLGELSEESVNRLTSFLQDALKVFDR